MNSSLRHLARLFLVVIMAWPPIGITAGGKDQGDAATGKHKLVSAADALIETIVTSEARTKELKARFENPEREDRQISVLEVLAEEKKLRDALDGLLDNIKQQEQQGLDTGTLITQAKKLLAAQSASLKTEIKHLIEHMDEMRKGRDDLEPKALLILEIQLSKLSAIKDNLLTAYQENTQRMQVIGMDTDADLEHLDQRLLESAEKIKGRIQLTQENVDEVKRQLSSAMEDQKPELETQLAAYRERLEGNTTSLAAVTKLMNIRDLKTTEYKQLIIQTTGEITGDILDIKVAFGLFTRWLQQGTEWLKGNSLEIILKVALILLILFVSKLLGNIAGRVVDRAISSSQPRVSRLSKNFFVSISSKLVLLLGILIALSQLGIQLAPLLAGFGIVGFIMGFALQDTLSNFASGVMVLVYRPFDVGDIIEAGGVMGKVSEMSLVSTTILTFDNQKLVVPNNKIWGDVIRNVTAQRVRRVDMTFGIGYSDDISHAERILTDIVVSHEHVLKDPEPVIKLHNLGDSSVDFVVRPWVKTENYWNVYWDITRRVKEGFDEEGISIPFPQRDVHLHQESLPAG